MARTNTWKSFPLLWALLWAAVVVPFDAIIAWQAVRRIRSADYPRVPGVVTRSSVETSRNSEGVSYQFNLGYVYEVDGVGYEGDRHSYGLFSEAHSPLAVEIARKLPAGTDVDVYYNPVDHSDSALQVGLNGVDLMLPLFMTPFNIVMVAGVWTFFRGRIDQRRPVMTPLAVAGITMLALSFALIFLIGFTAGFNPPIGLMQGVWTFVFATTAISYVVARLRASSRPSAS